jgi:NAD(P)-dependent dehydrogenase (short-subunit alcohol dehydrogenase family)
MSSISVVLVTNVGQGFGRAIALAYGEADFDVVCADRDGDLASKTAAEIEELGGQAIPIQADMSAHLDVQSTFAKVFEIFGDLSGVVHVASFESHTPFRELGEGEFAELLQEDFRSSFLVLKAAARRLDDAWLVLVAPPGSATEPHMLGVNGAISRMATGFDARHGNLRVNVVVPSRSASDPKHDASLVESVRYLGSSASVGISGHRLHVELPPPPKLIESLLPEVRAALDENVRQDDLEASLYEDDLGLLEGDQEQEEGQEKSPWDESGDEGADEPDPYLPVGLSGDAR